MRLIDVDDFGVGRCSKDVLPAAYCAGWNGLCRVVSITSDRGREEQLRMKGAKL